MLRSLFGIKAVSDNDGITFLIVIRNVTGLSTDRYRMRGTERKNDRELVRITVSLMGMEEASKVERN
jgi:hypothetical protein